MHRMSEKKLIMLEYRSKKNVIFILLTNTNMLYECPLFMELLSFENKMFKYTLFLRLLIWFIVIIKCSSFILT